MTERDALRAARDELVRTPRRLWRPTRPHLPFTYENNQPLAAIIANGGVGLLRAEIALQLVDMVLVGIQPLGLCHFETFSSAPRDTLRNHPYNNVRFIA